MNFYSLIARLCVATPNQSHRACSAFLVEKQKIYTIFCDILLKFLAVYSFTSKASVPKHRFAKIHLKHPQTHRFARVFYTR